ncbi:MAG: VWA domain-containing protein [Candidatus Riflebacteria bacterium]|nr:VWA domain-containing protein [Candidatus Riflebacteria bacterium]
MSYRNLFIVVLLVSIFIPGESLSAIFSSNGSAFPVVQQKAEITINNQVALVKLEQKFFNPTDSTVECELSLPLNEKASIQEFGMTDSLGNRKAGVIEEKGKAAQTFSSAQMKGVSAAMGRQTDANSFETKVGIVPPRSYAVVDVSYSEILVYKSGKIFFSLPLNLKNIQEKSLDLISVTVSLHDQKKIVSFSSPSHSVSAKKKSEHECNMVFEKTSYLPDADFQMVYEVQAENMGFNFLTTRPEQSENGYFMMLLAPQEIIKAEDIAARDIVFVMDVSGSMQGQKIEQTKSAFRFFIEQLNADDNFNVVAFSDSIHPWSNFMKSATVDNRTEALKYIDSLNACGGTNIQQALDFSLNSFQENNRTKAIIFLTDGQPTVGNTNIWDIANSYTALNAGRVRTFVYGVGEDVSTTLLDQISGKNMGEVIYVRPNEDLKEKLISFYETISKPLLTDVSVNWGGMETKEVYPSEKVNIYKGSQVSIFGRYSGSGAVKLIVSGNLNGKRQEYPLEAVFPEQKKSDGFIARLWAKTRADVLIKEIRSTGIQDQQKIDEVINLSKAFQFTTPYTSFIAVDQPKLAVNNSFGKNQYGFVPPQHNMNSNFQSNTPTSPYPSPVVAQPQVPVPSSIVAPSANPQVTVVQETPAKPFELWGAAGFFPAALLVPNFRKAREQAREKACYANMRVLLGAVEMYNLDNATGSQMHQIDEEAMKNLTSLGYLKGNLNRPETFCGYYSAGDLASPSGYLACLAHGTVESDSGIVPIPSNPNIKIIDKTPLNTRIWNQYHGLIELAINIPILIIGLYFSYLMFIKLPLSIFMAIFTPQSANRK